jgi:hypothetical protein
MLTCFDKNILNLTHLTLKKFIEFFSNKYEIKSVPLKKYVKTYKCSTNKFLVSDKFLNIKNFGFYKLFYKSEKKFLKLTDERHPYAMIKKKYITSITEFKSYLKNPEKYIQDNYINRLRELSTGCEIGFINKKNLIIITIPRIFKKAKNKKIHIKFLSLLKKKYKKVIRKKTFKNFYSDVYHIKLNDTDFYKL